MVKINHTALELIGRACAIRRKKLGYTQTELANKVGTYQQHIANFETGKQNIAIRTFIAILELLDMHLELMEKDPDNLEGFAPVNKN